MMLNKSKTQYWTRQTVKHFVVTPFVEGPTENTRAPSQSEATRRAPMVSNRTKVRGNKLKAKSFGSFFVNFNNSIDILLITEREEKPQPSKEEVMEIKFGLHRWKAGGNKLLPEQLTFERPGKRT